MPGWQRFTKTSTTSPAAKARLSSADRSSAVKRLAKSEAATLRGMMRAGDKIIEGGRPKLAKLDAEEQQRSLNIDPNAYRTRFPFVRVESPHGGWRRRVPGWTDCRFVLPETTLKGLRALTIQLAHQQQNSTWASERCSYPRTKNFYVVWALNQLFEQLGFGEFCVPEQNPAGRRVRRFVAKS